MGQDLHTLDVADNDRWPGRAADVLAAAIEAAVEARDQCLLALSGGSTPGPVFEELASRSLPWRRVVILQVDERLVPLDDQRRNLAGQEAALGDTDAIWLPLPVDELLSTTSDARRAAVVDRFCIDLLRVAGDPPVIDIVHLGLGPDGHTASLLPGDPLVDELRDYVGFTGAYEGTRRVSLTRAVLDRARMVVWLVSGADKAEPLGRLLAGDMAIPAGLIRPAHSVVLADADAARQA